jgi:FG-GAP-like repeat
MSHACAQDTSFWRVLLSSTVGLVVVVTFFGVSLSHTSQPDFDGDSKTDIAVYRPSTGVWLILNSASFTSHVQQWRVPEDIPVPGDYDGDGKTDIAVYQPSTGVWFILNSASFTSHVQQWGGPEDQPLPGQF